MRATIPQSTVDKAGVTTISVGQLTIGPVRIGELELSDFHLGVSTASASLENLRVTLTLDLSLEWWVGVQFPLGVIKSWHGTIDLGSPSVSIPLGDVTVPGLESLTVDVNSLATKGITAVASPIADLTLGSAVAEQIRAQNVTAPAQGFSLAGLGLGGLQVNGAVVPAASIDTVDIGRVHGEALPVAGLTLTNVELPEAAMQDVASQGVDVDATAATHEFHADAGLLRVKLSLTPEARGQIDRLALSGIRGASKIGSIELKDVVAPYELLNLKLSDLGIERISVPTLGVS